MSARGLAIVADIHGEPSRAFDGLADARRRCRRLADPYVWLDAHILDAQCELGRVVGTIIPTSPRGPTPCASWRRGQG